jgi:hypothetical protein
MAPTILDHWTREENTYFNHMTEFVDLVAHISPYTVGTKKRLILEYCDNVLFF